MQAAEDAVRCRDLLSALVPIEGVPAEIIVIDNEEAGSADARNAAERAGAHYRHQPKRGIPQARNAALDAAQEIGATHLAFIDDDETASQDWLVNLWAAMATYGADAVQGSVNKVYPADTPKWRRRSFNNPLKRPAGTELRIAATNNVLLRLESASGLRFDERLQFTGSEDTVFFHMLHRNGRKIVYVPEAVFRKRSLGSA